MLFSVLYLTCFSELMAAFEVHSCVITSNTSVLLVGEEMLMDVGEGARVRNIFETQYRENLSPNSVSGALTLHTKTTII
jgi:hypothetical protein